MVTAVAPSFDRDVPLLLIKVGRYPLHHGSLGAIRSLGRLGVPVFAVVEDQVTPAALSRYVKGRFVWPTSGTEPEAALVDGLAGLGRQLHRRSVAVATDDEAAVLLAEHAAELEEWFIVPHLPPGLPRTLASKRGLFYACRQHGVPTPAARFPSGGAEVESLLAELDFPVVVKNVDPWMRLRQPAVPSTTVVATAGELHARARGWPPGLRVMLQEYIPRRDAEDWIFHGYCNGQSESLVAFTGVKLRSWPPHAGVTTHARTVDNRALADQSAAFCRLLGYHGIVDMDWRFDRRDGNYKLVDFNPRVGAQFRLFQNEYGIDVVRALHLDLTGRAVPAAHQVIGRRLIVENLDAAARFAYRHQARSWADTRLPGAPAELAWAAADDPVPLLAMALRSAGVVTPRLIRLLMALLGRVSGRWRPKGPLGPPIEASDR